MTQMTTLTLTQKAATIGDPQTAGAPEKAGDLRTVDQVDWQGLVVAALGPTTSIDLPLPQLLLAMGGALAGLTTNAEHLKGFVGGTATDQEDLAESVHAALRRSGKKISDQATTIAELTRRVEQLEAALTAPADLSSVQTSDVR